MLADIITGHGDVAEVLFIIAAVLATLAALTPALNQPALGRLALGWLAVALLAVGWLVL